MVRVTVLSGEADEMIGDFDFQEVPRSGEYIFVPWAADKEDLRIFTVGEVNHVAAGTISQFGKGPKTVLRYCEEIT